MRFYRALLRLYPAGFLADYRHELSAVFAERMREHTGPLRPLRIAAAAVVDVVPNALAAHRDILQRDVRYALRALGRAPGFTITAILVVALGVGANTAAFSLADFVLVRPLAFPESDRLVNVWGSTPGYGRFELSPPNFRDWRAMARRSFSGMGAYTGRGVNLVGTSEPRRLESALVTPELPRLLGVPALVGRTIQPADSMDGAVAVLGYALWQGEFGGDPGIVGRVVRLDGNPHTIVGVMPPSFRFPDRTVQLWTPLVLRGDDFADRTDTYLRVVARLRDGATVAQAREELAVVAARLERDHPQDNEDLGATVLRTRDDVPARTRLLVLALCGAALCILLLACANLASLLLTRATHRSRELAVRAALGAGRERLVRQLVTESLGLAMVGGLVGVALAAVGVPTLAHLVPSSLPVAEQPSVDLRVLGIAVLVVAVTGLLFGVAPAISAGRRSTFEALRDGVRAGGGRTRRLRASLVVIEVAASVVLLVSSGLLIRAVWQIQATDPGFRADGVLTMRTALPLPRYDSTARRGQFYARVLDDVRALPGVLAAAYASGLPMRMRGGIWSVELPGETTRGEEQRPVSLRLVTPQYFATLGIPLRGGRDVEPSDTRDRPFVAVVSESFARRHWPGQRAIGKRFGVAFAERTVVGVVVDVRVRGLEQASEPQVYLPHAQVPDGGLIFYAPKDLVVRATAPASALLPAIRAAVRAADPEQPVSDVGTMPDILGDETAPRVTQLRLLAALAAIALLIAGVGVHGLLTFTVSQRSQELAVRRALGAQVRTLVGLVLGEGMALAATGVVVGVALAYPLARAMRALLADVRPADPATLAVVALLCLTVALVGCLRPAMRAARADPVGALRGD